MSTKTTFQGSGRLDNFLARVKNALPASDATARPGFPGENHALLLLPNGKTGFANYIGPGTQIAARLQRNDPPRTAVDGVARQHDIDYYHAGRVQDKAERERLVRDADNKMIKSIQGIERKGQDAPWNTRQANLIIAKTRAEDAGLLDRSKFQQYAGDRNDIQGVDGRGLASPTRAIYADNFHRSTMPTNRAYISGWLSQFSA